MSEFSALLLSCAIEAPVAYLIVRLMHWPGRGASHAALASAVATAITHPQLWQAALWAYPRFGVWRSLVVLELLVVAVEGLLIAWMAGLRLHRAMIVSLAANTASFVIGVLMI